MPIWQLAAAVIPAILGHSAQQQAANRAAQQAREAQRRYDRNYAQLENLLSGILSSDYSAVSPELIDALVGRAGTDIARAQARTNEQILRDQARRGLAGHSLVDQRQAYVDERAQDALADARLRAELEAQNLTAQQQAQARSLLAGVTADNMRASQLAAQNLLDSYGQAADTFSTLAGTILGGIDWQNFLKPKTVLDNETTEPTATLSTSVDTGFDSWASPPKLGSQRWQTEYPFVDWRK